MSTVTLKKLDRDLSTVRLDLNSLQGATSGIGIIDPVDLGSLIDDELFLAQSPYPEIYQQAPARKQVAVHLRFRVKAADRATRLLLIRNLMLELNTPGPYVWKPDASADAVYFDGFAAEFPAEFHGQDYSQSMAVTKADDIIEVTLWRMPYLYEDRLDAGINELVNAMMWIDSDNNGTPDGWTKINGTLSIDMDSYSLQIVDNAANDKVNQDINFSAGTVVTASIEAIKVSGDRTATLQLISRPSGTSLGSATITATTWGTRLSVTGTVAGGDTAARLKITYSGGTNSTTVRVRNAQLEAGSSATKFRCGVETVGVDPATGGRLMGMYVQGNAPTRGRFIMTPNTGSSVVEIKLSKRVVGNLVEFANAGHFQQSSAMTLGTNVSTSSGDASASGSSKARCSFSNGDMLKRWSGVINVTDSETLLGTFKVMGRMKFDYAPSYTFRLHWSPGVTGTPAFVCDRVKLEPDSTTTGWVLVELGTVSLDQRSTDMTWELWGSQDLTGVGNPGAHNPGAANADLDYIFLIPVGPIGVPTSDEHVTLNARGWKDEVGSNRRRWRGDELVKPAWATGGGGQDGDFTYLQQPNHVRATPPLTGMVLSTGRYFLTLIATITHKALDNGGRGWKRKVGELKVVNTSGTELASKDITIVDSVSRSRHKTKLSFDNSDSNAKLYAVKQTGADDVDIKIHQLTERFQRTLDQNSLIVYSGEYGHVGGPPSSYIANTSGVFVEPLYQEGPFFELNPGPNLILVDVLDLINAKNEDLDPRHPTGVSSISRTVAVEAQHYPRWFA